jgi:hypothetical protein
MRQRAQIATGPVAHSTATDNSVFACAVCGTNPCIDPRFCIVRRQSGTPQTTIEAILYSVRARGLQALKEPANIERLSRCDVAARAEINERIASLIATKRIAP